MAGHPALDAAGKILGRGALVEDQHLADAFVELINEVILRRLTPKRGSEATDHRSRGGAFSENVWR